MEIDTSIPSALAPSSVHSRTKNRLEHIGESFDGCFYSVPPDPWGISHKALLQDVILTPIQVFWIQMRQVLHPLRQKHVIIEIFLENICSPPIKSYTFAMTLWEEEPHKEIL